MGRSFHRNKFADENEEDLEAQKAKQLAFREKRLQKLADKQAELNVPKKEE